MKNIFRKIDFNFKWPEWLKAVFLITVFFCLISLLGFLPGIGFLRYYIDGHSIYRRAFNSPSGTIMWEVPKMLPGYLNEISNNYDATISPDAKMLILTHKFSENNRDLYISRLINKSWTAPKPITEINSKYNEENPALSYDGKMLFFCSDRPGGKGGSDIWCSIFNEKKGLWSIPYHLGGDVNSKSNDSFPSLTPDGSILYFSSDRQVPVTGKKGEPPPSPTKDYNLYSAKNINEDASAAVPESGPPGFTGAQYIKELNTPYDEGKIVVTGRGDLAYFCSNRPGGVGGYDIYRCHYFQNKFITPGNFGFPVNTIHDEISPTLSMEGFKIFFCSNRYGRSKSDYGVYETVSRQVISRFDYSILIAMTIVFVAILLIYYLLRLMLANVDMKTITKCLLISIMLHLLFLVLSGSMYISGKMKEALLKGPEEMTININNLARENISVAIREGIASLPKIPSPLPATRPQHVPNQTQQKPVQQKSEPIARKPSRATSAATPVSIAENDSEPSSAPFNEKSVTAVKPSLLGSSSIRMEVPAGKSNKATGTSKGTQRGLPKPERPTIPRERVTFKVAKAPPVLFDFPETDANIQTSNPSSKTRNDSVLEKSILSSLETSESKETLPGVLKNPKLSGGTMGVARDSGTLFLPAKLMMETMKKDKRLKDDIKLGLLQNDNNITRALALQVLPEEKDFSAEKLILHLLALRRLLEFSAFNPFDLMMNGDKELDPVGQLIYANTPLLDMPADSELEIPESYLNK